MTFLERALAITDHPFGAPSMNSKQDRQQYFLNVNLHFASLQVKANINGCIYVCHRLRGSLADLFLIFFVFFMFKKKKATERAETEIKACHLCL